MAIGQLTKLFPGKIPLISNSFYVNNDVSQIKILGMRNGDEAIVEVQVGQHECDMKFVPYAPNCCGELVFCYPQNEFYIGAPNVYRLVMNNRFGSHITDPAWFENLEIYQMPVDNKYLNLAEGNFNMGCSQEIRCTEDGITIDGVLCRAPDTFVTDVTVSASGWNLVRNDGVILPVPLTSVDNSVTINGNDLSVETMCEQIGNLLVSPTRVGG
jgi:hypothetical protein